MDSYNVEILVDNHLGKGMGLRSAAKYLMPLCTFLTLSPSLAIGEVTELKNCYSAVLVPPILDFDPRENFNSRKSRWPGGEKWGEIVLTLKVDDRNRRVAASVAYDSSAVRVPMVMGSTCTLSDENLVDCVSAMPVPHLGHLDISFSIGEVPTGLYYVDILAENFVGPVATLQTALDCQN